MYLGVLIFILVYYSSSTVPSCVPTSDGVREALSTHFGRPGPWAGLGKGISLKISRATHSMVAADSLGFCRYRNHNFITNFFKLKKA